MPSEAEVLQALSAIIDPDFNQDIVTLGFVRKVKIEGAEVSFDIALTTPACPVKDDFRRQAEAAVGALPDVQNVAVNMTASPRKPDPLIADSRLKAVRSIIAVSSCKGGVGKSTVVAGLAKVLAQRGHRVGLLDADIFGPSVPTLFNLHGQQLRLADEAVILPLEVDGLKVVSFGFLLGDQPAVMRGPMVSNYIQQLLHAVEWGELDYLFIDMPPGTGDIQLTITQSVQLDGAVIVTTPHSLSLMDVGKGILMFDKVKVPVLGVIENMAYFVCDDCGKKHFLFGQEGARKLGDRFGLETLAQLPLDPARYGLAFAGRVENAELEAAADRVVRALGRRSIARDSQPTVTFSARTVTLKWPGGETVTVNNLDLRAACECARCRDEFSGERLLDPAGISPTIMPQEVRAVGNYAIRVVWNDGHDTGLYPYARIRELAGAAQTV